MEKPDDGQLHQEGSDRPQVEVDEATRRRLISYYASLRGRMQRCERLCASFEGDVRADHYRRLADFYRRLMKSVAHTIGGPPVV